MEPISYSLREVLVRQGIANAKPVGAGKVRGIGAGLREGADRPATVQPEGGRREPMGMKGRGAASDGARSQLRQREEAADLNSGKGRAVNAPAKFTGLRIVVDNSRNWRTQPQRVAPLGVRQFLVLVQ